MEFTTTSPSCPFEEILFQDINDILSDRFREATSICVRLVLDPPWTLEPLSENARRKLGWVRDTAGNFVRQRNFIN
jgi:metal-sulfur cluster biosynthetic enzyme